MAPEDIGGALRLCRESRWNQLEDDWRCFLSPDGGRCWLAEKNGSIVGTVGVLRYGASFSWVAMMLVDPGHRRLGIGSTLMEVALDALADEPCVRLDATPFGEPMYRRFQFVPEHGLSRIRIVAERGGLQPLPGMARHMETSDFPEVFERDLKVFGADRSWLLASFYRRAPEFAWVSREGRTVTGYCFGRPGYLYNHLGPILGDQAVARELVAHCLSGHEGSTFAIDIAHTAPGRIPWLETAGFEFERTFLRMCRGVRANPTHLEEFAIAGPEFG